MSKTINSAMQVKELDHLILDQKSKKGSNFLEQITQSCFFYLNSRRLTVAASKPYSSKTICTWTYTSYKLMKNRRNCKRIKWDEKNDNKNRSLRSRRKLFHISRFLKVDENEQQNESIFILNNIFTSTEKKSSIFNEESILFVL